MSTESSKQTGQDPHKGDPDKGGGDKPRRGAARGRGAAGPTRGGLTLLWTVLLLVIAALAVGAWWAQDRVRDAEERIAALEGETDEARRERQELAGFGEELAEFDDRLSGQDEVVSRLEERHGEYDERIATVEERTENLRDFVDGGRSAWHLAEVEYLLQLAATEINLGGRPETAEAALIAADERLERMADPTLIPVREAIAADLSRLTELEIPDLAGKAHTLSTLAERVGELPLSRDAVRPERRAEADPEEELDSAWQRFRERGAEVLSDLIIIRHEKAERRPLLAPEQEYFLRRNLELELATARTALLREQPEIYQESLEHAAEWLETYFDSEDAAVADFAAQLDELREARVAVERPEIGRGLERLRLRMGDAD